MKEQVRSAPIRRPRAARGWARQPSPRTQGPNNFDTEVFPWNKFRVVEVKNLKRKKKKSILEKQLKKHYFDCHFQEDQENLHQNQHFYMNIYILFEKSVLAEKTLVEICVTGDVTSLATWALPGPWPRITSSPRWARRGRDGSGNFRVSCLLHQMHNTGA